MTTEGAALRNPWWSYPKLTKKQLNSGRRELLAKGITYHKWYVWDHYSSGSPGMIQQGTNWICFRCNQTVSCCLEPDRELKIFDGESQKLVTCGFLMRRLIRKNKK